MRSAAAERVAGAAIGGFVVISTAVQPNMFGAFGEAQIQRDHATVHMRCVTQLVAAHQQFGFENNFQFVRRPARTVNKSHRFPTD
jgi:hypothetical protein